jgi:hypothetical protein
MTFPASSEWLYGFVMVCSLRSRGIEALSHVGFEFKVYVVPSKQDLTLFLVLLQGTSSKFILFCLWNILKFIVTPVKTQVFPILLKYMVSKSTSP